MNQYVKRAIPVTAFQWREGEPWVEGMTASMTDAIVGPVCCTKNGDVAVNSGDWIMQGDGEYYPCPDEVFQKTYVLYKTDGMTFGQAVDALKAGKKVARSGWNGKGMFVYYVPANSYPAQTQVAKEAFGEMVQYNPYFAIRTVQGTVSTWVPSVNDCLAGDWGIVE